MVFFCFFGWTYHKCVNGIPCFYMTRSKRIDHFYIYQHIFPEMKIVIRVYNMCISFQDKYIYLIIYHIVFKRNIIQQILSVNHGHIVIHNLSWYSYDHCYFDYTKGLSHKLSRYSYDHCYFDYTKGPSHKFAWDF